MPWVFVFGETTEKARPRIEGELSRSVAKALEVGESDVRVVLTGLTFFGGGCLGDCHVLVLADDTPERQVDRCIRSLAIETAMNYTTIRSTGIGYIRWTANIMLGKFGTPSGLRQDGAALEMAGKYMPAR
ncbi:MAG: hypothetical protein LBL84_01160 [Candidatus Nomurabacteria bacterium]|jgi:hypothetical protein|nr:hypothetical protein [Candidatus Nomurabacteria bacterium]